MQAHPYFKITKEILGNKHHPQTGDNDNNKVN